MECPLTELREVFKKVRPGGRLIVGIKNEGVQYLQQYKTGDTDNHLYTWNALLLGNMVRAAGFRVDEVLPSLEERSQRANEWDTNAVSSYRAFIYHWLHSTKVA